MTRYSLSLGAALLLCIPGLALADGHAHAGSEAAATAADTMTDAGATERGRALITEMVATVGGMDKLHALKDMEIKYTYRNPDGKEDVSLERYVFDGELSWARYDKHEIYVFPDQQGPVIQGYDGKSSWTSLNGQLVDDPEAVGMADFIRKTNYYWLLMMPKMLDPGVHHKYEGTRTVDGKQYHLVRVGFGEGIGDAQDTYLLYINPQTKLVDRFLFTVMDFQMAEPHLMLVQYADLGGIKLPVTRKYATANWEGELKEDAQWVEQITEDVHFTRGFDKAMFSKPAK